MRVTPLERHRLRSVVITALDLMRYAGMKRVRTGFTTPCFLLMET